MNQRRCLKLRISLSLMVVASLLKGGCNPWSGPASSSSLGGNKRGGKQGTMKLYYSENITTTSLGSFSTSSPQQTRSNKTVSLDDSIVFQNEADEYPILAAKTSRKRARRRTSSTLTSVVVDPPSRIPASTKVLSSMAVEEDKQKVSSVREAFAQVNSILDLYELTPSLSSDIVSSAIDGLIGKIFQDRMHTSPGGDLLLQDLEALVWRSKHLGVPLGTIMSLKMLLTMQRQTYEILPEKTQNDKSGFVERSAKLLLFYSQGVAEGIDPESHQTEASSTLFRWPNEDIRSLFRFIEYINAEMVPTLYDLFEHIFHNHPDVSTTREFVSETLQVLAASGPEWVERQYQILIELEDRYQATNRTIYNVSPDTLKRALQSASKHGDPEQATWLFRRLYSRQKQSSSSAEEEQRRNLWCMLLESYAQSNETGSVAYMERLVETQEEAQHTDIYNIVLKARAAQKTSGSGLLAARFLMKMETLNDVQPNLESLCHVVSAYLDEEPLSFQSIADADALVRRMYGSYNFNDHADKTMKQQPVFERILDAYSAIALQQQSQKDNRIVVKAAEASYQFFLLQHRNGRTYEMPSNKHLGSILAILNSSKPGKYMAERSLEFFRLHEKLKRTGVVSADDSTNIDNIRQLLGILAKSRKPGYGDLASEMLQRATFGKTSPQGMDQMVQNVAQCQQLDDDASMKKRQQESVDV